MPLLVAQAARRDALPRILSPSTALTSAEGRPFPAPRRAAVSGRNSSGHLFPAAPDRISDVHAEALPACESGAAMAPTKPLNSGPLRNV